MSKHIPYIKTPTNGNITIFNKGIPMVVSKAHANYDRIVEALIAGDMERIISLYDVAQSIAVDSHGLFDVEDGKLLYQGEVVHNAIATRIMDELDQGFKVEHLCNFYKNLQKNPSATSVAELYLFLEAGELPITEDGCFLAYKIVTEDCLDCYTKTIDNSVGAVIRRLNRNQVDDNRERTCSFGYHVCSFGYLPHYGNDCGKRVMVCKVNPADVVAVPKDYNDAKMRVTFYEVIDEVVDYNIDSLRGNFVTFSDIDDESDIEENYLDDIIDEHDYCEDCQSGCDTGFDTTEYKQVDLLTEQDTKPEYSVKPDYTVKLNPGIVREIDKDLKAGYTKTQISNKYGISARQAGRIETGESWGHVTGR